MDGFLYMNHYDPSMMETINGTIVDYFNTIILYLNEINVTEILYVHYCLVDDENPIIYSSELIWDEYTHLYKTYIKFNIEGNWIVAMDNLNINPIYISVTKPNQYAPNNINQLQNIFQNLSMS